MYDEEQGSIAIGDLLVLFYYLLKLREHITNEIIFFLPNFEIIKNIYLKFSG